MSNSERKDHSRRSLDSRLDRADSRSYRSHAADEPVSNSELIPEFYARDALEYPAWLSECGKACHGSRRTVSIREFDRY